MPKKKSVRKTAAWFINHATALEGYYQTIQSANLTDQELTWATEGALIKLNAYFEQLMLFSLVGAINNNNTAVLGSTTGVRFPRHLTDEVCEFIVTGGGYFDFRGRDGLIKALKSFVPETHYLVAIVKQAKYAQTLERLIALRNFAAHESTKGKSQAKMAVGNLAAAGVWLKRQNRFLDLTEKLKELADEIRLAAPY